MSNRANMFMQNNGFLDNLSLGLSTGKQVRAELSDSQQPDLTLRLSIGGSSSYEKPLAHSSSAQPLQISSPDCFLSLARTCFLPAESDRQARVMSQVMMRMEGKRKQTVQRGGIRAANRGKFPAMVPPLPPSMPSQIAACLEPLLAQSPALCRAILNTRQSYTCNQRAEGWQGWPAASGASSSASQHGLLSSANLGSEKLEGAVEIAEDYPFKKAKYANATVEEIGMELMRKMPSVTTTGTNGEKVEGFLYNYCKDQVIIICLCHGSFHSPEEFIRHAGGTEVENPMRHINVCPASF